MIEAVEQLREQLQTLSSDLLIRFGSPARIVKELVQHLKKEEKGQECHVSIVCAKEVFHTFFVFFFSNNFFLVG